mmetsp:Transcript_52783/g.115792  ORF Transcript_52783/g.115792 Transcript_52783/m.115792 type:complete len:241 (-) Transcript_52783:344-1066(-)
MEFSELSRRLALRQATLLHQPQHLSSHVGRRPHDGSTGSLQGFNLGLCGALASRDDGSSVSHSTARGCGDSSNERDDRLVLGVVRFDVLGSILLGLAADFADHNNSLSLRILQKPLQAVNEVGSVERIPSDADTCGLSQSGHGCLMHRLVGESSRSADHTDLSLLMDVARHNSDLALTRLDDARAIGPNQPSLRLCHQRLLDLNHVLLRDALRDAHNKRNLSIESLQDGGSGTRRRHVND